MYPTPLVKRLVVAGASALLTLATATSATASTTRAVEQWPTRVWFTQGRDHVEMEALPRGGHRIKVCDKERDGHRVYVYYEFDDGAARANADTNGSKAGCGSEKVSTQWMVSIALCEELSWRPDMCEYQESGL